MEKEKIREKLISIVKESAEIYKDFIVNSIYDDPEYYSLDNLFDDVLGFNDQSNSPYIMFNSYIKELRLNDNTYSSKHDKINFFNILLNKVFNDIKDFLAKYGESDRSLILQYIYGSLWYNRYLGSLIVQKQANNCLIISDDQDYCLNLLFKTMESSEKETREVEQYIATQEEALELLIKIVQSFEFKQDGMEKFQEENIKQLFLLIHVLVLDINTKHDVTIGINKEKEMIVDKDGIIELKEPFEWGNLSLKNYDYKFDERHEEYNSNLVNNLNNNILWKLGFNFDDINKLQQYLISIIGKIVIVIDKSEWLEIMNKIGIENDRAQNLFNYFVLETFKDEIIIDQFHKYTNSNYYPMLCEKIFIEFNGTFICNISQSITALNYYIASAFNTPHKFVSQQKLVDKIAESFCKLVENRLKDSFQESQSITNFHLSSVCGSKREIDVLFVIKDVIYIIECKRLGFSENNTGIQNEYAQLIKKYSFQLNSEIEDFQSNQDKIMEYLQSNNLIQFENEINYTVKGIVVIKEFSPAQLQSTSYPIIRADQLVEYLRNDIKC